MNLGPNHYAIGISTNEGERFQGFHGELLVILTKHGQSNRIMTRLRVFGLAGMSGSWRWVIRRSRVAHFTPRLRRIVKAGI